MRSTVFLLLVTALALQSCSIVGEDSEREKAQDRWDRAGIDDYAMTLERSCFCAQSDIGPFDVVVRGGAIESVTWSGDAVPANRALTIDAIFQLIRDAEDRGAHSIRVEYDDIGFPRSVFIDYDVQIADEEIGYTITSFARL